MGAREKHTRARKQAGFTLIEAMASIVVLGVGILSLAAFYTQGIFVANMAQYDYIAEKKAEQAVETIFTARDTKLITWAQVRNVSGSSGSDGGIFLDGPQKLLDAGPDGLVGTADDNASLPDVVVLGPGPDGKLGTADDDVFPLSGMMTREIQIRDVQGSPNLRQITVIMRYQAGRLARQYTLVSYISAFA
jgi:prepilin-type N-terminal cleavage/methylation domain-containing protein